MKEWRSCYWHPELKLFLVVYVDDFRLAGPKDNLKAGWDLIEKGVTLGGVEEVGLYLGCKHKIYNAVSPYTGRPVRAMEYDMSEFLQDCIRVYKKLTGVSKLRKASTPFYADDGPADVSDVGGPKPGTGKKKHPLGELVETDEGNVPYDGKTLSSYASTVLMKVLYAARMARFDLLRCVGGLASMVTKWDAACDRQLYRLMCYIETTLHLRMVSWCGDERANLGPHLYSDADFAGCKKTKRSTSGVFMCVMGPNTSCPLSGMSKKQTAVSHSTPEAEIVSADLAMRTEGIPALELWEVLLGRSLRIIFHEDNQATIAVCKTGKNPTMRHLGRTHQVDVAWLHERFQSKDFELQYTESEHMAADIFTKAFTDSEKWKHACSLINLVDPATFWTVPSGDGGNVDLRSPHTYQKAGISVEKQDEDHCRCQGLRF